MREYNVALKEGVDYDGFWNDIESDTDGGKLYIPNRKVEFTNERPASLRQCWYLLTDEEAETLRNDDRVYCVEIPPEYRTDIVMMPTVTQTGDFTKTTSDSGAYLNWGLIRSSNATNVYGTGTTTALNYTYTLDGTGVDVVIQDSGLQVDHPEFQDGSGNTRVQQINWGTYSGGAFTQNANHYRDFDGHGTHCAGIACGKTYGWAKEARVYSQKLNGLEGAGDGGTGISITFAFDAIKTWHTSKAGARPTIINMSWGYGQGYNTVTSLTYRGTSYTDGNTTGNASYRYTNYGLNSSGGSTSTYLANVRVGSVDTDIEELIAAGVIVCIAAGNRGTKIDVSGGTDYNNFVVTDGGTIYYHRGSSPYSDNALMVGSMDSTVYDATNDQRATYSETGPGVSIWAPGTDIMSATSNTNKFSGPAYYLNASFKQCNISGTSMATPQVAGVAALVLQLNPTYTPAQVRTSLLSTAGSPIYTTGLTNDYSNTRSLLGSSQKVLYSNYNLATTTTTTAAPTTTTTTAAPTTTTTTTTTTAAPNTFNVTNNGSGNYVIGGNSNPTLSVIEGQTCTFNINAVGHPFWIRTVAGVGITNAYNSGVTNNGEDSGTITFVVPYDAPSTLYYNCEYHSSMGGIINVTNVPTTTTTTAAPTTTTTTTEAPPCVEYRCLSSKGGYIFWTDCTTGLPASTSINGGKVKFISSITYPIPEKGSNTKITKITT
jgi:subtilisin family serine protease